MERKRVLVIGKSGQLARCLADEAGAFSTLRLEFLGSAECNVANPDTLWRVLRPGSGYGPEVIINLAAFHDLRACEADFDTAFRVNALGITNLLDAMPDDCHLYHLSTDYVFGGLDGLPIMARRPHPREDGKWLPFANYLSPSPVNNYGRTKRAGELIALESGRATVIRTASLFSKYGSSGKPGNSNFLLGMLKKAQGVSGKPTGGTGGYGNVDRPFDNEAITVDSNVVMSPTYAPWLARAILYMVAEDIRPSLAHLVCDGPPVSWFDFAKAIFYRGGCSTDKDREIEMFADAAARLVPKQADAWPPRPRFSALENSLPNIGMGTWQAALEAFFLNEWPKIKEAQA